MNDDMYEVKTMASRVRQEQGFTLIEAMMSVVILAIGLIGLAGMTTVSFTRNADSSDVTIATNLAAEMVERMQFNRRNLVNGYGGIVLTAANPALCLQNPLTQPVALGDCLQWQARLFASGLRGVNGRVAVVAVGPVGLNQNTIAVTVAWNVGGVNQSTIVEGAAPAVPVAFGTKQVLLNTMIAPE